MDRPLLIRNRLALCGALGANSERRPRICHLGGSAETLALASPRARPWNAPTGDAPGPAVHLNVRPGVAGGLCLGEQPALPDPGASARHLDGVRIYRTPFPGGAGTGFSVTRTSLRGAQA